MHSTIILLFFVDLNAFAQTDKKINLHLVQKVFGFKVIFNLDIFFFFENHSCTVQTLQSMQF